MIISYTDDLKITSAAHNESKPYVKIENRSAHAFVFRTHGAVRYLIDGKSITVNEGEFIFLPKGCSYERSLAYEKTCYYTSINFQGTLKDPAVKVFSSDVFYGANYIAQSFAELWNFGSEADKYKCLSLFYDLLSHILTVESYDNHDKRKHRLIDPAIEHLNKHIYDNDLKIDKLHRLCGISDTYFRKIFASKFSTSPQGYVLNERITRAKSIIESGDYESIREISEAVGYNDPLYFSKAFKKHYGLSPTAYEEKLINE